jgi:hypothetical protein
MAERPYPGACILALRSKWEAGAGWPGRRKQTPLPRSPEAISLSRHRGRSGGQSTQCDVRALPGISSTTRHCIGLDVVGKKGYPQRREYPCRYPPQGFKQILYARPEQRPNNPTMLSMIVVRSEDAASLSGPLDAKNQSGENSPEGERMGHAAADIKV